MGAGGAGAKLFRYAIALAASAGLSMLEAHRALHQLIDQELLTLEDEVLKVPDPENLNAVLDA